eukprot:3130171-Amphidinium_carterae.1
MKKRKHDTEDLSIHSVELFHKQEAHIKKLKEKCKNLKDEADELYDQLSRLRNTESQAGK